MLPPLMAFGVDGAQLIWVWPNWAISFGAIAPDCATDDSERNAVITNTTRRVDIEDGSNSNINVNDCAGKTNAAADCGSASLPCGLPGAHAPGLKPSRRFAACASTHRYCTCDLGDLPEPEQQFPPVELTRR